MSTTTETPTKIDLGTFEGRAIWETSLKITKAGDGLSEAMKTEPQLLHQGDEVYIVIRGSVSKVQFQPAHPGAEGLTRVHVVQAGTAALVDADSVQEMLDLQEAKNAARREAESLQGNLGVDEHNLRGEHALGMHAEGLVENCPLCAEEADATEAEQQEDELAARRGDATTA